MESRAFVSIFSFARYSYICGFGYLYTGLGVDWKRVLLNLDLFRPSLMPLSYVQKLNAKYPIGFTLCESPHTDCGQIATLSQAGFKKKCHRAWSSKKRCLVIYR